MTSKSGMSMADFDVGVTLGTGSFGRVRFAKLKTDQTPWAIKMLKKCEVIRLQQVEHMLAEKAILADMVAPHPFVPLSLAHFADGSYLYTCYKLKVAMDLAQLLSSVTFDEATAQFYVANIMCGVQHLHDNAIVYRGLRPEGICIASKMQIWW